MHSFEINKLFESFAGLTGTQVPKREADIWHGLCRYKLIPAKTILLHLDDLPDALYFVLNGLCRQYYIDSSGEDITRGFIFEGGYCCAEAPIEGENSSYCVETLEECRMLVFSRKKLDELLRTSAYMKDVYIKALEKNIRSRVKREKMLITCSAVERYRLFLYTYPNLADRVKQVHLATYLGVNQVTLSRVRKTLRENKGD